MSASNEQPAGQIIVYQAEDEGPTRKEEDGSAGGCDEYRGGAGNTVERECGVFLPATCRLGKAVSCHRSPKGLLVRMMRVGFRCG